MADDDEAAALRLSAGGELSLDEAPDADLSFFLTPRNLLSLLTTLDILSQV